MHSVHTFGRPALRRTLATAAFAVLCGISLSVMAQPTAAPAQGPGPGWHGSGMAQRMGPGMGYGMDGGFGMLGGRGMDRALDAVNASADQKAQIRQVMQGARTDLAAQRDARQKLHEQMRALFTAPNIDASAVEALRQQMLAQHDATSKRMTQAMLDAARVLTPEQRKALADRMTQRRTMMQRHRAERQSLGGAPTKP